jgi:MoxR-like ATPase
MMSTNNGKSIRPSPTASATSYPVGHTEIGNDYRLWQVQVNSNGVQRWVPLSIAGGKTPQSIVYKFNVGDKVRVIYCGAGCGDDDIGKEVRIIRKGKYGFGDPAYEVSPAIGNSKTGSFDKMIGESAFVLIESAQDLLDRTKNLNLKTNTKSIKMAKIRTKSITKKVTQEVRTIETSLINKEEVFKMLALAEATGLPCLLIGSPGTGKTKTVIDYAKAWLNKDGNMTAEDFMSKIYILETDEGTKSSEVKGIPDLQELFTNNNYKLNTPIAEAEIVIINEVDKASSGIRNAMLGVMNEKFLFNGKHKIPCKWKLFIATCNEIPKDEADSPFWDRFMLKTNVNRVSAGDISKYYSKGDRNYKESFKMGIPNKTELETVDIPVKKLDKYLEVGYQHSSDRTLTFVPKLAKAVSYIWDISIDKALVKTAQIMISQSAGSELQNKLMSAEVKAVMSKVEMLQSYTTNEQLEQAVAEIESLINLYATRDSIDEDQVEEIERSIQYILNNHSARKDDYQTAEAFDTMLEGEEANLPF